MPDPDRRFIGTHADQLKTGRQIEPGQKVPASQIDPDDPLIAEGLLIEIPDTKKKGGGS